MNIRITKKNINIVLLISITTGLLVSAKFAIVFNLTESLPHKVWLGIKGVNPKKGDYLVFKHANYKFVLIKQITGVEKDIVSVKQRDFYINDQYIGTAKTHSLQNEPLSIGMSGIIGKGQYFVSSPHKDGFDSRYEKMGWVSKNQVRAVAYPLW